MHNNSLSSQQRLIILLCIIISVAFCTFFQLNQLPHYDQGQMFERGIVAVFDNIYIPHGNEASTTSNVPGSLSSFIIGFPLKIYFSLWSPMILLTIIKIISGLLFLNAVSKLYSPRTVTYAAAIFFLNPWFLFESISYNPSYLCLGATLVLNALVHLRCDLGRGQSSLSYKKRFFFSALAVLGIGWSLQFHFSWPVLLALCGLLWLRRSIKVSYLGLIFGVIIVLVSLIPYFQEVLEVGFVNTSPAAYKNERYLGYGLVHVYPLLKAVLYWIRLGSLSLTHNALLQDPQGLLAVGYNIVVNILGGITALAVAYFNYKVLYKFRGESREQNFGRELSLCGLGATLIAAGAATLVLNYWQIIIMFVFCLIPVLEIIERTPYIRKAFIVLAVALALVIDVQASLSSEKYRYDAPSLEKQLIDYCATKYGVEQCTLKAQH
jgi:hypothetical protein